MSFSFRRAALAKSMAESLYGKGFPDAGSGLFLAAPRRIGKSTFLREDLVPALISEGAVTIYVDLWADRSKDPALLIADAIKRSLHENSGRVTKAVKAAGLKKVDIKGASFDIDRIGQVDGITLTDALLALTERTGRPVALLVDEAQHALASDEGLNAMFALKAARDSLNQHAGDRRLLLVFTGSHRDKLANLILKRDQPFYGAQMTDFPLLGKDYSDAYTEWVNARLAADNQFEKADVFEAFSLIGSRPEILQNIIGSIALSQDKSSGLKRALADGAASLMNRLWQEFDSEFSSLTPLQRAVLIQLIKKGDEFSPFSEGSIAAYSETTGTKPDATSVQSALGALREKNVIWRSSRGSYTLDDQSMAQWFERRTLEDAANEQEDVPHP